MAYGLSPRAFFEGGPFDEAAKAESPLPPMRSWEGLNEASRLELIEQALLAANDRIDGYPFAL